MPATPASALPRLLIVAIITSLFGGVAGAAQAQEPGADGEEALVYRVPITGTIDLGLAPFVKRSIEQAEEAGADAVILDIETPGGRIDAAQQIVDAIRASSVPVYAYVNHRALSAGAMISLATEGIYMRPGSVIGAATPVTGQGETASEKVVSYMRSEMRALASEQGLDPRIAEAMVDKEVAVPGVVESGDLLTLTTDEAVEVGYATAVEDWEALLAELGLAGAEVVTTETNWAEGIVRFLTNPIVAPFLLSLGFLALIVEVQTPTFGIAGLIGVILLGLFFGSRYLVGLAGMEEFLLLGVGLILLGLELFLIPGFGLFGILGIAGLLGGIYFSLIGDFPTGLDYNQAAGVLSISVLMMIGAGWALVRTLPRSERFLKSGVLLGDVVSRDGGYSSAVVRDELVGAEGVALTDLRPAGAGTFDDERIDVVAEAGWISSGTPIRIVRAEGYRHVVRAVADT